MWCDSRIFWLKPAEMTLSGRCHRRAISQMLRFATIFCVCKVSVALSATHVQRVSRAFPVPQSDLRDTLNAAMLVSLVGNLVGPMAPRLRNQPFQQKKYRLKRVSFFSSRAIDTSDSFASAAGEPGRQGVTRGGFVAKFLVTFCGC